MRSNAKSYDDLRQYLEDTPIVDCHDHTGMGATPYRDPIEVVISGYFGSDIQSASSDEDVVFLRNTEIPLKDRWPVLERAWNRACHTGYAQVTRRVLKRFYNADTLSLEVLEAMAGSLVDGNDAAFAERTLDEARIAARIEDCWPNVAKVLDGTCEMSPRGRLAISLPGLHGVRCWDNVQANVAPLKRKVATLDEYLDACRELFEAHKRFGAVTFKDQSAYTRPIDYGNPARAEAETVFNWFMADPRRQAAYPDGVRPLDDYLFQAFMRMARDMHLPVQIHTGHMAGIRNDVAKTNAAGLRCVLEMHPDVRFDLFHANWPYSGDLLYLCKNYPNVSIDFCWANIIDPLYCQNLFKQALSAVPHGKVHGYGSDFLGQADRAWAHASIARDNIAIALADMVEMEYLGLDDAKQAGRAWLFDNANDFFRLGL